MKRKGPGLLDSELKPGVQLAHELRRQLDAGIVRERDPGRAVTWTLAGFEALQSSSNEARNDG